MTSVNSDPPRSTSNKIKKETLVPTNNKIKNEIKKEAFVAIDNKIKNELFDDHKVKQEEDINKKNTIQLLSKICFEMKEIKIEVQKDSNKKKSIKAPNVEVTRKNPIVISIKEEPKKIPVGEVHAPSAPNGKDASNDGSKEGVQTLKSSPVVPNKKSSIRKLAIVRRTQVI